MIKFLRVGVAACVLIAAAREGAATPVTNARTISGVDLASAGVGGLGSGTGTIALSGVSGTVIKAFLYWHGIDAGGTGAVYDNDTVSFDGNPVTGVAIGDATTNCWGNGSSRAFRADVTTLVAGNGSYTIGGLGAGASHSGNGASLIVVFDDGNAANNRDLVFFEGNDSNIPAGFPGEDSGWHATLANINYGGGSVFAEAHLGDGQNFGLGDGTLVFSGAGAVSITDTASLYDGNSVPDNGTGRATNGALWDIHRFDVTGAFGPPGLQTLSVDGLDEGTTNDCLGLIVLLLDLEAGTAPCGNGQIDSGEECDPQAAPTGCTAPDSCLANCTCGCDQNEDCDDLDVCTSDVCTTGTCTNPLIVPPPPQCVPTTTSTSTSTTVTTATTSSTTTTTLLNHFQCYEMRKFAPPPIAGVAVEDQFGLSTVTLSKPNRLCAPTNKRGEDPTAPADPAHLKAWQDKHTRAKRVNHTIVNQFGSLQLDVTRPVFLFVPASKGLNAPPPPLAAPTPDHFQCYKVRRSRAAAKFTRVRNVSGVDQFGAYAVDLLRPAFLCAPANKNDEDPTAPAHPEHLLCYKARNANQFVRRSVFVTDQFGTQNVELIRRIELCVPSLKDPAPTTTTTGPGTTTTSSTTTVTTSTVVTTTTTTSSSTTTSSTTTTTLYGSPSRAFLDPVRSLVD